MATRESMHLREAVGSSMRKDWHEVVESDSCGVERYPGGRGLETLPITAGGLERKKLS